MFLLRPRFGPLGLAFTAYQLWRRLSPSQKAALRSKVGSLVEMVPRRGTASPSARPAPPPPAPPPPPVEAIRPDDLTSPGTVSDPDLEQRRAEEALVREKESRATDETKFDERRREQETERRELASGIDEPTPPDRESGRSAAE